MLDQEEMTVARDKIAAALRTGGIDVTSTPDFDEGETPTIGVEIDENELVLAIDVA